VSKQLDYAAAMKRIKKYRSGTYEGFVAFCTECVMITGGDDAAGSTTAVSFKFWPGQRELAKALCDPEEREILLDKSRQIGITWVVLAWFLWRAMFLYGIEERITSVGQEEASKALRRVKFMIDNLPEWCRPPLEVANTTTIKFEVTGSWITALPATINAGRGDTLNDILCDEMAFQIYAREIMRSAGPSLEKRHGKRIGVSTANGSGNYFQQEYVAAQQGKNGWKPFFFGWKADPTRTQGWYDRMMVENGPEYMHENYPETWQQSFLATGRPYFAQEVVAADLERESMGCHDGFLDGKEFITSSAGVLRVWEQPREGRKYVMFTDVAEGLEHGDWSNGYVVDTEARVEVARVRGKMDVGELADVCMQVGEWYGAGKGSDRMPALLAIEANNHGIAVIKRAEEAGYRNLYRQRNLQTGEVLERTGWLTTETTRRMMLGRFQADYRLGRVSVRDRVCLEEMAMFAHRGPRGKAQAPAGGNDDCVVSRAGAHYVSTFEGALEVEAPANEEDSGIAYWMKKDQERLLAGKEQLNAGLQEMGG